MNNFMILFIFTIGAINVFNGLKTLKSKEMILTNSTNGNRIVLKGTKALLIGTSFLISGIGLIFYGIYLY